MSCENEDQVSKDAREQLEKQLQEYLVKEARKIYGSHAPLDNSTREIRLLSLLSDDPLSGELHVASLRDDYIALSYVWGDWHNRHPIRLNGFDTTITANLAFALRRLHTEGKAQKIWIDAVCINQTDTVEKNHQVRMMSEIYGHSKQTFLWLGESENDSDVAMDFVSTVNQKSFDSYDPSNPSQAWQALRSLLKREWWKRMWVIQETMLSRDPVVKCGSREVGFDRFAVLRTLHEDNENAYPERFISLRWLWRDCPFGPLLWLDWRRWVGASLSSWLLDAAPFRCEHLRDKVYALLGVAKESSRQQVEVEYDSAIKSNRQVMIEAATLSFQENGLLSLQTQQVEKSPSLQLPSWCPDWTIDTMFVTFVGFNFSAYPAESAFKPPPAGKWLFGGDQPNKPRFMFSADREILYLHGFVVDTVDFVDETPEIPVYIGDDIRKTAETRKERAEATANACLRWEQHVQKSKNASYEKLLGGYAEAFCRTVIANRSVNSEKLKSNVKPIFDAWMGRGLPSDLSSSPEAEKLKFVQSYSFPAVRRCVKRAFITTANGYFGLAPRNTKEGDLVCLLYTGDVAYILRKHALEPDSKPGSFIGEAYVHGIMEGEYLQTAKEADFTAFWVT